MAAPNSTTMKKLDGSWMMNKTLSDDPDPILALQGISWLLRKGIAVASVTLKVKEYQDDAGKTHLDVEQRGIAGISGWTEARTLDWEFRETDNGLFGRVNGKSRFVQVSEVEDDFLKQDWLVDGEENAVLLESYADSVGADWNAHQVWGFATVDGKRYHVRRVIVKNAKEKVTARLVYDYLGEN